MTKQETVAYRYAIKIQRPQAGPFVESVFEDDSFEYPLFSGNTLDDARLFNTATEAEQKIKTRASRYPHDNRFAQFVVVPVKLTTTRIIREDTVVERELA